MALRRIRVCNFRKFISPVVVEKLEKGLIIIAGDNEEGKSTFLSAIQAGLYIHHDKGAKTKEITGMQPYGSSVSPEVTIDFEIADRCYQLHKRFAKKPEAILVTPNGKHEGRDAERELANLLGLPNNKITEQRIVGLLSFEQNQDLSIQKIDQNGLSLLEDQIGEVSGGKRGKELLAEAKQKLQEYKTARRGQATKKLAEAETKERQANEQWQDCRQKYEQFENDIKQHQKLINDLRDLKESGELEKAQQSVKDANQQGQEIKELKSKQEIVKEKINVAKSKLKASCSLRDERRKLLESIDKDRPTKHRLEAKLGELQKEISAFTKRHDEATRQLADKKHQQKTAEILVAQARLQGLDKEIAELTRRVSKLDELATQDRDYQQIIKVNGIDGKVFKNLQELHSRVEGQRQQLRGVATAVKFFPADQQLVVDSDDEPVATDTRIELVEQKRFKLAGFGEVEITPSSAELAKRRRALGVAENNLTTALTEAGVASIAQAEQQFERRRQAEQGLTTVKENRKALAPDGERRLRIDIKDKQQERRSIANETSEIDQPISELREAEQAREQANEQVAEANDCLRRIEKTRQQLEIKQAKLKKDLDSLVERLQDATKSLADCRAKLSDEQLTERLNGNREELEKYERQQEGVAKNLEALGAVAKRLVEATRALSKIENRVTLLTDEKNKCWGKLLANDGLGIGEQRDRLEGEWQRANDHLKRMRDEAEAWQLLVDTLERVERDTKKNFLQPIAELVEPYLQIVFPQAGIEFDEKSVEINAFTRVDRQEKFHGLSVGTREQIAILVRLAFATYLSKRGQPAVVILDDALVYSDDSRLAAMHQALRTASAEVQIVILTCRERDWQSLDVPVRYLRDCYE